MKQVALKIKAVVAEVGKEPEVREILDSLESMQSIVGGYIECIMMPGNIDIYINEEGTLMNLPFNRFVAGSPLVGNIFAASHDKDGNCISLNQKQIDTLMKMFSLKESV